MIRKTVSTSRVPGALLVFFCSVIAVYADDIKVSLVPPVIEKVVKPGTQIQDAISFTNLGKVPLDVTVDVADFAFDEKGEVTDRAPGVEASSLAQYIRISPVSLIVPPEQRVYFRYSIAAPPQFSQLRAKIYFSCKPIVPKEGANRVLIVPRLGVSLYVENSAAKAAALNVRSVKFLRSPDSSKQLLLMMNVENKGERNIRPKGYLEVESRDGSYSQTFPFNDGKEPVLPGQTRNWEMMFGPVPEKELSLKLHFTTSFRNNFDSEYSVPAVIVKKK